MPAKRVSDMDDSWVVEEPSEGDISWDERSESGQQNNLEASRNSKMTRVVRDRRQTPARHAAATSPEPQLIMPTMSTSMSASTKPRSRKPASGPRSTPSVLHTSSGTTKQSLRTTEGKSTTSAATDKGVLIVFHTVEWFLDVLGHTLKALKKPISWLLAAYLFAGILMLVQNLLTSSIYTALSPVCRIPGVSLLGLPICRYSSPNDGSTISSGKSAPIEFDALMKTQSKFEDILSESAAGIALPLDMKRSESSIRDLRQIVRHSQIPSRNEMGLEFDGFVETARIASYDLQKFNSHVGRGVDIVLSTARWTERVLDDMAHKQSSRGIVPSFVQDKLLAPFKPVEFTESMLTDQYITHTRIVSDEIERLIEEAQALLLVLQNLDDRLDVIYGIAQRDDVAAQANKDEILSQLWTKLGGHRVKLGKIDKQLTLLQQVGEYRKIAMAHVTGTILKLQAMSTELEELRERVSSVNVLRHKKIPLAVHIENIKLGVERLEIGREKARQLEKGFVRKTIDRPDDGYLVGSGEGGDEGYPRIGIS